MVTIGLCLFCAFTVYKVADLMTNKPTLSFEEDIKKMDGLAKRIAGEFSTKTELPAEHLKEMLGQMIAIVDSSGRVVAKTNNVRFTSVDIPMLIQSMNDEEAEEKRPLPREHTSIYPVKMGTFSGYVVVSGMPQGKMMKKEEIPILPFSLAVAVFIFLFFVLTRGKIKEIERLSEGLGLIAKGELNHRITVSSRDEIGRLAEDINTMTEALQEKINQMEVLEHTKNELIVNVSHDLRTPLTSVMGYLQLLIDQNANLTKEQSKYLNIASEKSKKLKSLIDRLFEYTKLASHSVTLEKQPLSFSELVEQVIEEFGAVFEDKGIVVHMEISKDKLFVLADPNHFVRVLDNLFMNAISYCNPEHPIHITLKAQDDKANFQMSNSYYPSRDEDISKLFERFYRLDKSRTSSSGNSGLGLAITKSIVEMHDGEISVRSKEDIITFELNMPLCPREENEKDALK